MIKQGKQVTFHADCPWGGPQQTLACPSCGDNYLHPAFSMSKRKDKDKLFTTRTPFTCEGCSAISYLIIGHQKGNSYIMWEVYNLETEEILDTVENYRKIDDE